MIGTLESVWRYPVKSMRGEALGKVFVSHSGLIGDRVYAIASDKRGTRFPWFTGRQYAELIRHTARFTGGEDSLRPLNPEASHPDLPADSVFAVEVETPEGVRVPLDDPMFLAGLPAQEDETLTLRYAQRNFADVAPVSLISTQTVKQLGEEMGAPMDAQRFRMNLIVDWGEPGGFREDRLVGKRMRVGPQVEIAILERDDRCKMITLDPETGAAMPELLKHVLAEHEGGVGVYASVLREGFVQPGDRVEVLA